MALTLALPPCQRGLRDPIASDRRSIYTVHILYCAKKKMMIPFKAHKLKPFQAKFIADATAPGIDMAALSVPRGNGKSWLAAYMLACTMTPGHRLFIAGKECVLMAGALEQARIVFRFVRAMLEGCKDYKFVDSSQRVSLLHIPTNTRLRMISSNARTAFGLVNNPLVVADEPGSWEVRGGELMHDALSTSLGKPGSPMRVIYIGTLAPAQRGWWHDLIKDGSRGSRHVTVLKGDPDKWDQWSEIRRCNPTGVHGFEISREAA